MDSQITATVFPTLAASTASEYPTTLRGLYDWMTGLQEVPTKGACCLVSLSTFGEVTSRKNSLRHDANVLLSTGAIGDYDAGLIPPEVACSLLTTFGVQAIIVSTPSHGVKGNRWRVITPFSKPLGAEDRREMMGRLNTLLGGVLAGESFVLSQAFYVGRVKDVKFEAFMSEGVALDLAPGVMEIPPTSPEQKVAPEGGWELTTEPVAEWRGPVDDDELIRRACLSKSLASGFGDKASFADLWDVNIEVLSRVYPPVQERLDGLIYEATKADAALAAHLRFWTGGNEERMATLMRRSGLKRDKYERDDYLPRTIKHATANGGQVCCDTPSAAQTEAEFINQLHTEANVKFDLSPRPVTGSPYATAQDQLVIFDDCVYITDVNRVLTKNGQLLDQERFKARYGGLIFNMDEENRKTTDNPWACFLMSRAIRFPKVDGSCFRPDLPPRHTRLDGLGRSVVNIYRPFNSPRKQGDITPFLDLMRKLLPVKPDRDALIAYMAAVVQHIGVKFKWTPLIQGVEGNGKSTLNECVAEAVGRVYCHFPRASQIASPFNGWMYGKVFIGVDDIYLNPKQDVVEELKPMITSDMIDIQFKGADQVTREVCFNMMINCNSKDALRKTKNDRRFAPFYTAQQEVSDLQRDGMGGDYFRKLYAWLKADGFAIVSEFLHTYPIPDELNPANGWRAPTTSSTGEAIQQGLGRVEQEIMERVERGEAGFANGWISSFALDRMLEETRQNVPRTHRREILNALGYVWHPNLPDGRLNNPINDSGSVGRPRLFVKLGHLATQLTNGNDIIRAYQASQGLAVGVTGFGR